MSESTKSQGEWRLSTSNIYDINTLMGLAGVGILIKLLFSTNEPNTVDIGINKMKYFRISYR